MIPHRLAVLLCVVLLAVSATGCAGSRPAVVTNGGQVADLWWSGELTDQKGNRWDIAILPGVGPSLELAGDAFCRSGERFTEYGKSSYWRTVGTMSKDCFAFAGADCLRDFVVSGIGEDYQDTTGTLARLTSERPFGWIAQLVWRTLWGYAIKPVGRIALGPVGAVGGTAAGLLVPVGGVLYPPVVGTCDVAVMGLAVPAARIVWQQPAWLFSLINNEPDEAVNGSWGLRIIARPPGWKSPAVPPAQEAARPLVVDEARMRRLARALVELEERLVRNSDREHATLLRVIGLQDWDGRPTSFSLDPTAHSWLATTATTDLESWRSDAVKRLGANGERLPSTDELIQLLRHAVATPQAASAAPDVEHERDTRRER